MMIALIAGATLGLLGSLHCIGMCGPIALALPVHRYQGITKLVLILSYNAGRILTYTTLGTIAGIAGQAVLLASSGRVLSIFAGTLIVISAVLLLRRPGTLLRFPVYDKISSAISNILRARRKQGLFLIGLLNGLLPCGLIYMALTAAIAQGSAIKGAALMAAFGAGTVPVMLALPYAGSFINVRFRNATRRTVPYFIAITGILLVLRGMGLGIPYLSPAFGDHATCHQTTQQTSNNTHACTGPVSPHNR